MRMDEQLSVEAGARRAPGELLHLDRLSWERVRPARPVSADTSRPRAGKRRGVPTNTFQIRILSICPMLYSPGAT